MSWKNEKGNYWLAVSDVQRYKRYATTVVGFTRGQQQDTYGSYAAKLPNVNHQNGVLQKERGCWHGSYAARLPSVQHQNSVLQRKDRRRLFRIHALLQEGEKERNERREGESKLESHARAVDFTLPLISGTVETMLPLICQMHHMLTQEELRRAVEISEDAWRRKQDLLWKLDVQERKQEEDRRKKQTEQESENHVRHHTTKTAATAAAEATKTETEAVEEKTSDEVEEQIQQQVTSEPPGLEKKTIASAQRSNSGSQNNLLPSLFETEVVPEIPRKARSDNAPPVPGKARSDNAPPIQPYKDDRRKKGAGLYGAIKRKLTPTPAKFRIHSDPETDNSLTLNSDASAPSHWWHESTSPNARSRNSDKFDEDRLSPNEMAAPDQREDEVSEADKSIAFTLDLSADDRNFHVKDEISGIAPEDRNLQCPDQSILNRFLQDTEMPVWVLSPCSKRIRPNSGLLEIQTDYSIEMEQPTRWGMGTE